MVSLVRIPLIKPSLSTPSIAHPKNEPHHPSPSKSINNRPKSPAPFVPRDFFRPAARH